MKNILLITAILSSINLYSQNLLNPAGSSFSNAKGTLSFSIGEVGTSMYTSNNGVLSEGFQQVYDTIALSIDELTFSALNLSIYPNPTTSFIYVDFELENTTQLNYTISDTKGSVLQNNYIYNNQSIQLNHLSKGVYLIKFITPITYQTKTFRIIKK